MKLLDFFQSFINAMQKNGQSEGNDEDLLEIIRILINAPQFHKISPNAFKKAVWG